MSQSRELYLGQAGTSLFAVKTTLNGTPSPQGSRRRRLWEMCGTAQCPVVGICLPMIFVKKLADKHLQHRGSATDYETHCAVVVACKMKSAFSKLVQEQLDLRYHNELRTVQAIKSREALETHWNTHKMDDNFPGVFWSVLSHPRCDAAFEFEILGHAHMLQHQAGCERQQHANRMTGLEQQLKNALASNHKLEEKYQALQVTFAQMQQRQQETISALQTELASQEGEMQKLKQALNNTRHQHPGQLEQLEKETQFLRAREVTHKALNQAELTSLRDQVKQLEAQLAKRPGAFAIRPVNEESATGSVCTNWCEPRLDKQCVLCVGGRPSAVPLYRQTVEDRGATFLHHDGGQEEGLALLDSKLNSADLVICQAGCVSHEAYFRVKEHCKKHGVQCVYVQNPSKSALKKALQIIAAPS
jgi:hypothetical protein